MGILILHGSGDVWGQPGPGLRAALPTCLTEQPAVVLHSSRTQDSCSSGKDKKLHVVPVWSKVPQWGQKHTMFVRQHVYYALVLEPGLGTSGSLEP